MALHIGGGPQRLVDHALETSTSEQCIAIVHDTTSANLRWANNTLTTNGVMHAIDVTVIAFQGAGNASVSGTAVLAGPGACARWRAQTAPPPWPMPPRTGPSW